MTARSSRNTLKSHEAIAPEINLLADADLRDRIEELAYFKAEARGFELGHELQDWVEAERELLRDASAAD